MLPVAICLLTGLLLQQVPWTVSMHEPLHFRLVQPNTKQVDKFNPTYQARITRQVIAMLTAEPSDLIVAPETAFPLYWNALPIGTIAALKDFATQSGTHMVFGIATVGSQSEGHNSMVHLEPLGTNFSVYDKRHLFPFGEYTPPATAWITSNVAIPMQNLSAGAITQPPFRLAKDAMTVKIGTLIFNEIMLSDEARHWAPVANLLINPGNLAWFDGTLAIAQGQQIARMRALEVNRPILRVSNTGDTALILSSGALSQMLPTGITSTLVGSVTGQTGLTPYARWGDLPVYLLCLVWIGFVLKSRLCQ
jgi:apolipoprotein N-acyltransferase